MSGIRVNEWAVDEEGHKGLVLCIDAETTTAWIKFPKDMVKGISHDTYTATVPTMYLTPTSKPEDDDA